MPMLNAIALTTVGPAPWPGDLARRQRGGARRGEEVDMGLSEGEVLGPGG